MSNICPIFVQYRLSRTLWFLIFCAISWFLILLVLAARIACLKTLFATGWSFGASPLVADAAKVPRTTRSFEAEASCRAARLQKSHKPRSCQNQSRDQGHLPKWHVCYEDEQVRDVRPWWHQSENCRQLTAFTWFWIPTPTDAGHRQDATR